MAPCRCNTLFPTFPAVKCHAGKMKPNRGEKWNIDLFFFFFYFFLPLVDSWWCFQVSPFFFTHRPFSFLLPLRLELSIIASLNSLPYCSAVVWWGLRRSWLFIRANTSLWNREGLVCVCVVFVCFPEPWSGWPVPDDQEPRRCSQHPRCPGDRVHKRFVCPLSSLSRFYLPRFPKSECQEGQIYIIKTVYLI